MIVATLVACAGSGAETAPASPALVAPSPAPPAPAPLATPRGSGAAVATATSPSALPVRPTRPPEGANVVLITVDSLRADMPWTGYPRPITPRLSAFAEKAVVYTRAYATSSYTSMSLGGLLAGRYPSELKRDGYFFGTYAKDNVFFPELLQAKGVRTMAGHAHGYFKPGNGFEQGFDVWDLVAAVKVKWNNKTDEYITSPELFAIAEKQLDDAALEKPGARFFAWYHFMDPHDMYQPHPGIGPYGKSLRDRYDAEVEFTDAYVGKLLDLVAKKSWGPRTVVILSSDHGESFGEHGHYAHGFELWENLVRVPLVVLAPGAAPRRIDTPRSHVDLARTILDVFGVEPEAKMRGESLVPEVYGAEAPARDVFVDLPVTSDNDRRRAWVGGDKKVISFGLQGLKRVFDLAEDPGELRPLSGEASKEPISRYSALEKTIVDVPPTSCKESCLNGAYLKKDGGT